MLKYLSLGLLSSFVLSLSPSLVHADWRTDIGTLRIGLVTDENTSIRLVDAEPFRLAVQDALNVPIELFTARDYPSLVRAHSDGRVEYAILSSSAYAAVYAICECVEPSVVAQASDGSTSYNSVIITRKNDGLTSPEDLKQKNILALSQDSIAGYSFPLFELAKSGNKLIDEGASISFGTRNEPAVKQFAEGKADALIGWSSLVGDFSKGYSRGTLKDLINIDDVSINDYRVIWSSSKILHTVHSVRKNLPGEAKTILRDILSKMQSEDSVAYDSIEPIFGGGFQIARQPLFSPIVKFAKEPLFGVQKSE